MHREFVESFENLQGHGDSGSLGLMLWSEDSSSGQQDLKTKFDLNLSMMARSLLKK